MTETFTQDFLDLLDQLNDAVATTREPVEGNLFYEHHDANFPRAEITKRFASKRANLVATCHGRNRVMEIGINAGHSALLMLYYTNIRYVGVDICEHQYTYEAMRFLSETFPGRVDFFEGDSVTVLPKIHAEHPDLKFDVVHVDGLHTLYHCQQDTFNAMKMTMPFAWMIIDDTDLKNIKEFYDGLISGGQLLDKAPEGWQPHYAHAVGMMPL